MLKVDANQHFSDRSQKTVTETLSRFCGDAIDAIIFRTGFDDNVGPTKDFSRQRAIELDVVDRLQRHHIIIAHKPASSEKRQLVISGQILDLCSIKDCQFIPDKQWKQQNSNTSTKHRCYHGHKDRVDPEEDTVSPRYTDVIVSVCHQKSILISCSKNPTYINHAELHSNKCALVAKPQADLTEKIASSCSQFINSWKAPFAKTVLGHPYAGGQA